MTLFAFIPFQPGTSALSTAMLATGLMLAGVIIFVLNRTK